MFQIKLSKFLVMYQLFCFLHLSPFRLFFVDSNKKKNSEQVVNFFIFRVAVLKDLWIYLLEANRSEKERAKIV